MDQPPPQSRGRSWSIYGRSEITERYEILNRIGSGAYADVYRGRRRSDGLAVALKEIHDYQSSFREIEALQALRHSPHVVQLIDYFWNEDDDAVLVLEFLPADLASVIKQAKRTGGIAIGEVKQWMLQVLRGVDDCHRSLVVHRDLKPSNLLISQEGLLKLADFGQARLLQESRYISIDNSPLEQGSENETWISQQHPTVQEVNKSLQGELKETQELKPICEDDYLREIVGVKAKYPMYDTDKDASLQDGDVSCLATCSTVDIEDDPFKGSYTYEAAGTGGEDESGSLTSCVGTRWFRAPELLYGSTCYGLEVDLWSLGCIFAELLSLEPLFPGTSDLDQLSKIIAILPGQVVQSFQTIAKFPLIRLRIQLDLRHAYVTDPLQKLI